MSLASLPLVQQVRISQELARECVGARPPRGDGADWIALVKLAEWEELRDELGHIGCSAIMGAISDLIALEVPDGARIIKTYDGEIMIVMRDRKEDEVDALLFLLSSKIVRHGYVSGGEHVRVTPAAGYSVLGDDRSPASGLRCARVALKRALAQLDLRPVSFSELMEAPPPWHEWMHRLGIGRRVRLAVQVLAALLLVLGLPLAFYFAIGEAAWPVTTAVFIATILILVTTATLINIEGLLSLRPDPMPEEPAAPYPAASAIICAYLPNEAATVTATVEALLAADYPARLQVVLAYNTPHDLPVERTLRQIAARDPRFLPLRVADSTSKAQNINAALSVVDGEFTAIFDADHRPDPDGFTRAWHWLSHGADVVQGHSVVRNGAATALSRVIAVEFEQMYGVNHPGRARLHGFGIFGGSNGYWRTVVLREVRMRSFMLTEDIDASMRALRDGRTIVADPYLISTELAPVTLRSLAHQRLRWAQGWLQVSLCHLAPLLRSPHLSLRQKAGVFHLLAWREIFPWASLQVLPVLAFWILQKGSLHALDWTVPLLLATTVYVLSTGPLQTLFTHANASPEVRKRKGWFLLYFLASNFYAEFLTHVTRIAHLRQLTGEREWRITPRSAEDTVAAPSPVVNPYRQGDLPPLDEYDQRHLRPAFRFGNAAGGAVARKPGLGRHGAENEGAGQV